MAKRSATGNLNRDNWRDEEEPEEFGVFKQASDQEMKGRLIKKARRRGDTNTEPLTPVFNNFTAFATQPISTPKFSFGLNNKITTPFSSHESTNIQEGTKISSDIVKSIAGLDKKADDGDNTSHKKLFEGNIEKFKFSAIDCENISEKCNDTKSDKDTNDLSHLTFKTKEEPASNNNLYFSKLKGLNVDVLKWIQHHVEKNPYISLIPVFDDYKKFLVELKEKYKGESEVKITLDQTDTIPVKDSTSSLIGNPNFSFGKTDSFSASNFSFGIKQKPTGSGIFSDSKIETTSLFSLPEKGKIEDSAILHKAKESGSITMPTFSFGNTDSISSSSNFSFGDNKQPVYSLNFGGPNKTDPVTESQSSETVKAVEGEPSDEMPIVTVDEVTEEGSVYDKKVKLFYKKDGNYVEKGVGTLFLKPAGEKTQLIVRALTSLGNILLNIILNSSIPSQRLGKNNVLIMCVPNPPLNPKLDDKTPVSMLIRVKTAQEADELLQKIEEHKK